MHLETETATSGRYTGSLDIAALLVGPHAAAVTAIDTRGLSNTGAVSFSVANPVSNSVRAQSITYTVSGGLAGTRGWDGVTPANGLCK